MAAALLKLRSAGEVPWTISFSDHCIKPYPLTLLTTIGPHPPSLPAEVQGCWSRGLCTRWGGGEIEAKGSRL